MSPVGDRDEPARVVLAGAVVAQLRADGLALWDGAMDAEYPLSDYTEVALRHAADESNNRMISGVANSLATAQSWLERMNDHGQLNQHLTDLSVGITALADQRLLKAEPGGDEFQLWFNLYRRSCN
mgnify:CR=1 FL=1